MSRKLRIGWLVWLALTSFAFLGTVALQISTKPETVHFSLNNNEGADIAVFRPCPANLRLSLVFKNVANSKAHGRASYRGDTWKTGILHHPEPGEPVKLKVKIAERDEDVLFEALPQTSHTPDFIRRDLVPFVDDGNPQLFPWPPIHVALPSGTSHLHISVVEVGKSLVGENVSLAVDPPLSFKFAAPGCGWLWWFYLWPIFVIMLSAYAFVLLWRGRKENIKAG